MNDSVKMITDKAAVLAALQSSGVKAGETNESVLSRSMTALLLLLDRTPESLLRDADIRQAILKRNDWKQPTLHSARIQKRFLEPCVKDTQEEDREFITALLSANPESFRLLPLFWREDEQVVTQAIQLEGTNLQHCAMRFRDDETFVRLACKDDGHAFLYAGPMLAMQLGADRDFISSILSKKRSGQMLQLASTELRHDKALILEGLRNGAMYDDVPLLYREDRVLCLDAMSSNASIYTDLPRSLQKDRQVVMQVLKNHRPEGNQTSRNLIQDVHDAAIEVFNDRLAMLECARECPDETAPLIFDCCSESLRKDSEVARLYLEKNARCYNSLEMPLAAQPNFYTPALDIASTRLLLRHIPYERLMADADMVIRLMNKDDFDANDARYIPRELFTRLNVLRAYAGHGGFLFHGLGREHSNDREICLHFLRNENSRKHTGNRSVVDWIHEDLRNEKAFVLEAIRVAKGVFAKFVIYAKNDRVVGDFDVILAALEHDTIENYQKYYEMAPQSNKLKHIPLRFARQVKRRIMDRECFLLFLFGMWRGQHDVAPELRTPLRMLERDEETTTALKREIAAYAGTPIGHELYLVKKVWENGVKDYLEGKTTTAAAVAWTSKSTSSTNP